MKVVKFDKSIYNGLVRCGFQYCYSKTVNVKLQVGQILIILTPVNFRPDIHNLPDAYDTYFNLGVEPIQIVSESENATILINLNDKLIGDVYNYQNSDPMLAIYDKDADVKISKKKWARNWKSLTW